jgi:hypothetical protein
MQGPDKERWLELSEQIAVEQDPEKFQKLVDELSQLLAKKGAELKGIRSED